MAARFLSLGLVACAVEVAAVLVKVPGGSEVDEDCIHQVANGAVVDVDAEQGTGRAECRTASRQVSAPQVQIYAADTHFESKEPITNFTADWIVPPLPTNAEGQVVYFWPGLKSQQPEMGYPVIQPVLQYGERGDGPWQLQSWFVYAKSIFYPVVTAPAITVNPGDKITSFISLSADKTTWTISGKDLTTGKDSTLNIKYSRAGNCNYTWALLVNENINVDTHCDLMPAASAVKFTNVAVNGERPPWTTRANCKGNPKCDCGNDAAVDSASGDVTLSWKTAVDVVV